LETFLAKTRDLIIIIGIYTYFTAFVYVRSYYDAFGISTESLKIDYSAYLIYAYNVVGSPIFLICALVVMVLLVLGRMGLTYVLPAKPLRTRAFLRQLMRYRFACRLVQLCLLFPLLYYTAQAVAWQDYLHARKNLTPLRSIQFVFRNSAEGLSPYTRLDSIPLSKNELAQDMALLKKDHKKVLDLLGESDQDFIVLQQPPYDSVYHQIPIGYIYYVHKSDVLLSRIELQSKTIK
jgi:hypothetical protein